MGESNFVIYLPLSIERLTAKSVVLETRKKIEKASITEKAKEELITLWSKFPEIKAALEYSKSRVCSFICFFCSM